MSKLRLFLSPRLAALFFLLSAVFGFPDLSSAQEHDFQPMVLMDKNPRSETDRSWISRVHLHDVDNDDVVDMVSVKETIDRTGSRWLSFIWTANDYDKVPFAERVDFGPNRVIYREEFDLILGSYASDMRSTIADLNGDSEADIIAVHTDTGTNLTAISVHYNTGRGSPRFLSSSLLYTLPVTSTAVQFADMDGDNDLDVVGQITSNGLKQPVLFLNHGSTTTFGPLSAPLMIGRADTLFQSTIAIGDVNNDGYKDVVQSRKKQDYIFLNSGTARPFSSSTQPQLVNNDDLESRILRLIDLDNDNDLDLVSIKGRIGQSRYYLNQGSDSLFSTTPARVIGLAGAQLCTLNVADFNSDGFKDLLAGQCTDRPASVRLFVNSTEETPFSRFAPGVRGPLLRNTPQMDSADIDNDGDVDFMTTADGRNMYLNNDFTQSPMPVLNVTAEAVVAEDIGSAYINVELESALPYPVRMEFGTSAGSAINGQDYYGIFERLVFQPGETQKSIRIFILEDDIAEEEESFKGVFSFVNGANIDRSVVNIKIVEQPVGEPYVQIKSARARESNGKMVFQVRLSHTINDPVSLDIATIPISGGAIPGLDYYGKLETVTLAPGEQEQNFTVEILDDSDKEGIEKFKLLPFNIENAILANPDIEVLGNIVDDRSVAINYKTPSYENVVEGQSLKVTLVLGRPLNRSTSIRVVSQAVSTATAGDDFAEVDTVLQFKPGQTRRSILISSTDDLVKEKIESFRIYMVDSTEGLQPPSQIWKTIRILDND